MCACTGVMVVTGMMGVTNVMDESGFWLTRHNSFSNIWRSNENLLELFSAAIPHSGAVNTLYMSRL